MVRKRKKNPWIAAILNLLFWGLGYIYNGKRVLFGVLILIADLSFTLAVILAGMTSGDYSLISDSDLIGGALMTVFGILITAAFASDAYKEAKEMK